MLDAVVVLDIMGLPIVCYGQVGIGLTSPISTAYFSDGLIFPVALATYRELHPKLIAVSILEQVYAHRARSTAQFDRPEKTIKYRYITHLNKSCLRHYSRWNAWSKLAARRELLARQ